MSANAPSSDDTLRAEIADLRSRLEEAEEALRAIRAGEGAESSHFRGEMLAQVSDAVIATDNEERVTFLNPAAERLYGVVASQVLGRKLTDVYEYRWIRPEDETAAWAALRERGGWRGENLHLTGDGRTLHVESSVTTLRGPDGAVTGMVAAIRDITDRKETEAALRQAHQKLETTLNSITDGQIVMDRHWRYTHFSEQAARIVGVRREDMLGGVVWDLYPRAKGTKFYEFYHRAVETGQPQHFEEFYPEPLNLWLECHCYPDPDGLTVYFRDVTERKQAEETLRLRAALLEAVGQAAIATDVQGRVIYWNAAAEQLYGWSRDEAVGRTVIDVTCPATSREQAEAILEQLSRGESWRGEFTVQDRSGRVFPAEVTDAPVLDDQGRLVGVIGISADLTERKRAEAQIFETTQQLQALMQAIPVGVVLLDAQGGNIAANPAFEQVWSGPCPPVRSVDDYAAYQAWWAETGEPLQPQDWASARAVQHGEATVGQLLRIRRFDDSEAIVLNSAAPIRDAGGRIIGSAVAIQDLTAWQESERRLAVAVSGTRIGLWEWNLATGEVLWNAQHARLFGLDTTITGPTPTAATTKTTLSLSRTYADWASRVHPEEFPRVEAELRRCVAERAPLEVDYRIVWPDGSLHWIGTRGVLELDGEGEPRRMLGIVIDITERKEAETALRESDERFRLALRHAPVWVAVQDRELRYVWAYNQSRSRAEEIIGKLDSDIFTPEEAAAITAKKRRVLEEGISLRERMWLNRPGGKLFLDVTWEPVRDAAGQVTGVGSAAVDLTSMKLAEEAAQASERQLLRSNRALRALSRSSQAMLHASEERTYLEDVCRIIVEDCGHPLVWIGFAEQDEAKSVRPVAWSGFEEGYLETLQITWAETERGRGPAGTAIRTGQPAFCRDMQTDPLFAPWREEAVRRGYAAALVFPLMEGERAFGSLSINLREPDPFTDDEVALLKELADDLAHGITSLRLRQERERAELALQAALSEKDVLLHEVHHRVKNNLQVISSLVSLQAGNITGPERATFENIRDQVRAMALVHEQLYQASDFGQIQFAEYARNLLAHLWRAHGELASRTKLILELQPVPLPLTVAVPCGLILNELAGNALKHAFQGCPNGAQQVLVSLHSEPDGQVCLRVVDNGAGLPEGLDWSKSKSLGLRLVEMLSRQIGGTVAAGRPPDGQGTAFAVRFSVLSTHAS